MAEVEQKENQADVQAHANDEKQEKEVSVQEQLAELLAENKRLKKSVDKASSEAASYKKQFMATKTEQEQAAMEKAEQAAAMKEELESLRKENTVNKYVNSYLTLGYSEKLAKQAAEAQYENDVETLFSIQKTVQDEFEKSVRSKILKEMPAPTGGNDEGFHISEKEFNGLSYRERVKLKREHPEAYREALNK